MARRVDPRITGVSGIGRITAGATLQTFALDLEAPNETIPLILRRSPGGRANASLSLPDEAAVIRAVGEHGLAVPSIWHVLTSEDELGDGFLMQRIDGETLPRRIIRMTETSGNGPELTRQLGRALARVHSLPLEGLPPLPQTEIATQLTRLEEELRKEGAQPRPVFELALKWLRRRIPVPAEPRLLHGDFRIGNVIVGPEGLRAVLDWEIAHIGDPAEDLAWMQVPPWRFGNLEKPVGGIGRPETLYEAYSEETGWPVDPERVRFFRVLGSLRWGVSTAGMVNWLRGHDPSVERAMIARRASENEIDLLRAIAGQE
ncbi:hypothetical protein B5C34_02740 [Pacificimonas flava]|uniref:Aminoglycoside phosphotransferase domain-containing protein n=2 Tax=Pacificimonas TaxID=1960290 RepID=A0A219B891_9SPHN|nr:hypothetical protein B5C34_02740 [Pacificimonas flava]